MNAEKLQIRNERKEGNQLLADFIDISFSMSCASDYNGRIPDRLLALKCRFHSDWRLLMRVVQMIEKSESKGMEETSIGNKKVTYQFSVEIKNNQCMIHRDVLPQYFGTEHDFLNFYSCLNKDKTLATWKACVSFVKWYNAQLSKRLKK